MIQGWGGHLLICLSREVRVGCTQKCFAHGGDRDAALDGNAQPWE